MNFNSPLMSMPSFFGFVLKYYPVFRREYPYFDFQTLLISLRGQYLKLKTERDVLLGLPLRREYREYQEVDTRQRHRQQIQVLLENFSTRYVTRRRKRTQSNMRPSQPQCYLSKRSSSLEPKNSSENQEAE